MADLARFRALTPRERAIVAVAVLLDGHDAADLLTSDKERSVALSRAARDLAEFTPELRMPFIGTLLRAALEAVEKSP